MRGDSPRLRRDMTGWRDRCRSVERPPALHGRPVLVPSAAAQVCELVRASHLEGVPHGRFVDVRLEQSLCSSALSPAVARSRCSYGSAVVAENVDTTARVADPAREDTDRSRNVTRPGEFL
jgi:hypothetical protein